MAFEFWPPDRTWPSESFAEASPDAGLPAHQYRPGRGKLSGIVCSQSGMVSSNTIVSEGAPDFLKSPFESNKDYFVKSGLHIQRLVHDRRDPTNVADRSGGKTCLEMHKSASALCGAKRHDIKSEATGKIYNQTMTSGDSPQWFGLPLEHNREFYASKGLTPEGLTQENRDMAFGRRTAGIVQKAGQVTGKMKAPLVHAVTGQVCSNSICSLGSPDHFKTSFDANREYYKAELGVTHSMRRGGADDDRMAEYPGGKQVHLVSPHTGELCYANMSNTTAPQWMRRPLLDNKEHIEKKHGTKLQECTTHKDVCHTFKTKGGAWMTCHDTGEKFRRNMVSTDSAPGWMLPAKTGPPIASAPAKGSHAAPSLTLERSPQPGPTSSSAASARGGRSANQEFSASEQQAPRRRSSSTNSPSKQAPERRNSSSKSPSKNSPARRSSSTNSPSKQTFDRRAQPSAQQGGVTKSSDGRSSAMSACGSQTQRSETSRGRPEKPPPPQRPQTERGRERR